MDIIIKNNDTSYYYLYKLLMGKKDIKYTEHLNEDIIENLYFKNIDINNNIDETQINIDKLLSTKNIKKVIVENCNKRLETIFKKYNTNYIILNNNKSYVEEISKLKSIILLRYILDDLKESIYRLKFLVLGNDMTQQHIITLFKKLNVNFELYTYDLSYNINLENYNIIIKTNSNITNDILYKVNKQLYIYDLDNSSKFSYSIIDKETIKYRYINNVHIYMPKEKANIILEVVDNNDSI